MQKRDEKRRKKLVDIIEIIINSDILFLRFIDFPEPNHLINIFSKIAENANSKLIYLPNGHTGYRQTSQSRQSPPWPISANVSFVMGSSAKIRGSRMS